MIAAATGILRTKLTPPSVRVDRVQRPRLAQQFSTGLECLLTLICAPAGYGKTTVLSEWFGSATGQQVSLAWLSLDEDDNDPARFLTYVAHALINAGDLEGDEIASLLRMPHPPHPKVILTELITRIEALPQRIALVLDDYHVITAQPVHDAVTFLLDHLPAQMHIVMSSREDPPFPLARLRGRGLLAEIRAADLRFTAEESGEFLAQMLGIRLSAPQIRDLDARTEGWIAGLQLAALAMKGREDVAAFLSAFTGSHRFILDYLTEEVLGRQPEDIQSFLLQTSILSRVCGTLCDAVTGRTDGQIILEQLERGNLFLVPLDDQRHWFRYHNLFADMLHKHLQSVMPERDVGELHRRASPWFASENLMEEAVHHAVIARDFPFAAQLMEELCRKYPVDSWGDRWIGLAGQIPDDVMALYPLLALDIGLRNAIIGEEDLAQKQVEMVRVTLAAGAIPSADVEELLGRADMIEGVNLVRRNELQRAIEAAERTLQRVPDHQFQLRARALKVKGGAFEQQQQYEQARLAYNQIIDIGQATRDVSLIINAMVRIADSFLIEGKLHDAEATCHAIIEKAVIEKREYLPFVGGAWTELAIIQFEANRLDHAVASAIKGVALCDRVFPDGTLACHTVMYRIYALRGDQSVLQPVVQSIGQILEEFPLMPVRITLPLLAHLWTNHEVHTLFRQAMPQTNFHASVLATQFLRLERLRAVLEQGGVSEREEAFVLLEELHSLLPTPKPLICFLEMLILEALVLDASGRTADALPILEAAVELAEPAGFFRVFVDKGEALSPLLHAIRRRNGSRAYVDRLLAAFENTSPMAAATPPSTPHLEPLSERELEVLRLIAEGASNRELAQQLVVTVGTVKKHMNNIFLKLDAHSRTQAVATARKHHLL